MESVNNNENSNNNEMINKNNIIIDTNKDINISDINGWTALHHASSKGDYQHCEALLKNNADILK